MAYFELSGYQFRNKGNIRDPRFVSDLSNFSPVDVQYNLNRAMRAKNKLDALQQNIEPLSQKYDYTSTIKDLMIVFVIGETTRGDHFGLNGYERQTTPNLAKITNLYSFKDATSCDTLTVNSVYCMSSPLLKADETRLPSQSSFAEILHSLGYNNEIYALQTMSEYYAYMHYDKLVSKYQVLNEQQQGAKDIALIPYATQAINDYHTGNKLLILHTLGSHQTYADRLTAKDEVFTPYCKDPNVANCQMDELRNAFDNTVIATDNFLATIIRQLTHKKALLIYISDHGESLGENGNYFHGKPVSDAPAEQFSIPFVVWFSPEYLADPEGQRLANNLNRNWHNNQYDKLTVSHDNVFHSILGCAGITSTQGIDSRLNLCSKSPN